MPQDDDDARRFEELLALAPVIGIAVIVGPFWLLYRFVLKIRRLRRS